MDPIEIDGGMGEGGGQIVRTAVTLSCMTRRPVRIRNIRANRPNPGLRPQHLAAIRLLGDICGARVGGLAAGSTEVGFAPGEMESKTISHDVGTAGSIPLVLSVLIPAVSLCKKSLDITITGGTDVLWSPTIQFTRLVLGEAYRMMGMNFSMDVEKTGYYPRGGGTVRVKISARENARPLVLDGEKENHAELFCSFSQMPRRMVESGVKGLVDELARGGFEVNTHITNNDAWDAGCSILVRGGGPGCIIGIDALWDGGRFGKGVCKRFMDSASVDDHLADMLVVPASQCGGTSIFRVGRISGHLETNLRITSKMTGCKYGIGRINNGYEVRIR